MVQSIELLLDPDAEQRVRDAWSALADAGLPSLATHTSDTNRPHVTLAVADEGLDAAAVDAVFRGWALEAQGVPAAIGSVVLFGGHRRRWVLARQVVPTTALLTLQNAVHAAIERCVPPAEVSEQTRPGSWTPHVTLARRIEADRLPDALAMLDAEPIQCRFVGARLWDSGPATVTPLGAATRRAA